VTFLPTAQSCGKPELGFVLHLLARPSYAGRTGTELVSNVDRASDA